MSQAMVFPSRDGRVIAMGRHGAQAPAGISIVASFVPAASLGRR
jgi:hypothetical protein